MTCLSVGKLTVQILAVVRFFQDREKQANTQEDEVWEKMGHVGPQHGGHAEMSRENSREGGAVRPDFANPVSWQATLPV